MSGILIATIEVTDPGKYRGYTERAPAAVKAFGGVFRILGGAVSGLEGPAPRGRLVAIEFESVDRIRGWYDSPAYQEAVAHRKDAADATFFALPGLGDVPPGQGLGYLFGKASVSDPDAYGEYSAQASALARANGATIVAGGTITWLEGAEDYGVGVMLAFPSPAAAEAFYRSPDYQALIPMRADAARLELAVAEGV